MMAACSSQKVFFRDVEVLGFYPVGKSQALRLRINLDPKKLPKFTLAVETYALRRVICFRGGGFRNLYWGSIPTPAMLAIPQPTRYQVFKGTKIKAWRKQFEVKQPNLKLVKSS